MAVGLRVKTKMQNTSHNIHKVNKNKVSTTEDFLVIEEPLQISISIPSQNITEKNVSITMRTPRQDVELALGFLFTEDIISRYEEIVEIKQFYNHVDIVLHENSTIDLAKLARHFYTTSSCGVCGKSSVEAIKSRKLSQAIQGNFTIKAEIIHTLPEKLRKHQAVFDKTGGLHAAAIFNSEGAFIKSFEDVGRHNALDKLIGYGFQNNKLPFSESLLLLSGRSSFELLQKASLAGIPCVASVGAPSSLALSLAQEFNITLIGFLKNQQFNIYNAPQRIIFEVN